MATAQQVIKAAFQALLIQDSEAPLEPSEYQDAIFTLNNMMADLAVKNVSLSWTTVTALTDTLSVVGGVIEGIIANLALKLAPDYDIPITPALALRAKEGMRTLLIQGYTLTESAYPGTLPKGSGNFTSTHNNQKYYTDQNSTIRA